MNKGGNNGEAICPVGIPLRCRVVSVVVMRLHHNQLVKKGRKKCNQGIQHDKLGKTTR